MGEGNGRRAHAARENTEKHGGPRSSEHEIK